MSPSLSGILQRGMEIDLSYFVCFSGCSGLWWIVRSYRVIN